MLQIRPQQKIVKQMFRLVHTVPNNMILRIVHTKILQINTLVQIAVAQIIKLIVTPITHSHVIVLATLKKSIESSQELIMATTHHYDIRTAIPIR